MHPFVVFPRALTAREDGTMLSTEVSAPRPGREKTRPGLRRHVSWENLPCSSETSFLTLKKINFWLSSKVRIKRLSLAVISSLYGYAVRIQFLDLPSHSRRTTASFLLWTIYFLPGKPFLSSTVPSLIISGSFFTNSNPSFPSSVLLSIIWANPNPFFPPRP